MDDIIKVLVVEDDVDQALLVQKCLEGFDARFHVSTTDSGKMCLTKISRVDYEAIILDYQLTDITGLDVLHEISEQEHPPVVFVSGNGSEQIAVEAMKSGAQDYLVKDGAYLSVLPKILSQIIERNKLKKKLSLSEFKYRSIFEHAGDALIIIERHSHAILDANLQAVTLFGQDLDTLKKSGLPLFFHGENREKVQATLAQAEETGAARWENLLAGTSSDTPFPVDLSVNMIEPKPGKLLCNIRDMSEKTRLREQIQNSQRKLQDIFDSITDMIWQVNGNFEIIIANKRFVEYAQTTQLGMVGVPYHRLFCKREQQCDNCPVSTAVNSLKPASCEVTLDRSIYEVSAYPIFHANNQLDSIAVYARDLTEKKMMAKNLVQSEKLAMLGLLASGIAHELRNPLNIIETARYYINEFMEEKSEDINSKLNIIHNNVKRSSKIINNLLEFSKHSEFAREVIDLTALIENTIALIKKELEAKNIEFSMQCETPHKAYFSIDSLKQVLLNLIINAIQSMQSGGKLAIKLENPVKDWVDIKVSDTGSGISEQTLPHIFSPFFTTKSANEGTGLGLYITQLIVERGGGRISVESKANCGTTFTVSLPAQDFATENQK